jgi:hypothetical protein
MTYTETDTHYIPCADLSDMALDLTAEEAMLEPGDGLGGTADATQAMQLP